MKTWKRKTKEKTLFQEYEKEIKALDDHQMLTLDHARDVFKLWAVVCVNENILGIDRLDFLETQESYIKHEVLNRWGACQFEIDRSAQSIIVKSYDGRAMNLKTGELI